MRKILWIVLCSCFSMACLDRMQFVLAQESQPQSVDEIADWLPETTVIFGRISPVNQWLDHPLRESLMQTEAFKKLWRSPQALQLRSGMTVAELALGLKLDQLAKDLTEQGAYVAVDTKTKGAALLLHTKSQEWLDDYIDKALDFLRRDAKSKGNPDPVQSAEYRGIRGYKIQNGIFAAIGPWMLVTNQGDLAKAILDHRVDKIQGLSQARWYRQARESHASKTDSPSADFWIDMVSLREQMSNNDLFRGQAKDFGAELILGGILSVMANAQVMQGSVSVDAQGVSFEAQTPSKPEWFGEARQHYVGPDATGHAPNWPTIPGSIATLATYRDVAQMWLRAGDLFDQNVNEQLAQADNTLTTIFAGKDFGTDILGAIEPQLQLFAVEPQFAEGKLRPTIQLPSFGLVAKLRDPAKLQRELKRTFQSFIGFLNVAGAQEGQPQLELDTIQHQGVSIYTAQYILDEDRKYPDGLPIQFNFSPTLAFYEDRMVLCSSVESAKSMVGQSAQGASDTKENVQTWLDADASAIQRVLQANSNPIIAQNMLEKGNTRLEAKREFDTLLLMLGLVKRLSMSMEFQKQAKLMLRLEPELGP
ncbi:MAG: hypothetical protein ACK5GJ_15535 [Planctomycetota bacterium]